ncbi:MAG: beta-lactamase family protein [Thermoanaerobaculia bacterium]|nr:beta-lactamase family protein [Thermoanaerobaculia bacterium]
MIGTRWRRTLGVLSIVLVVGLAWVGWRTSRMAAVAVGYPAKIVCSETFLADRELEDIVGDMVEDPILDRLQISVDRQERRVEVSLFGIFSEQAVFREGLGCTRVPEGEQLVGSLELKLRRPNLSLSKPPSQKLADAVAVAFGEPDPLRLRNTRAFVVMHHGEVVAERYAEGFTASSRFPGWSMTKSVTNALVGLLVQDGKLDVQDPAPVSEWRNDSRSAITLDQLLRMSSGLRFNEDYGMVTDVTRMLFVESDAGAFAARSPLAHPPDQVWDYSSGTTNIVTRIVRDHSEGDPSFARRRLFGPLGMDSAVIELDAAGTYLGSSFLYATARDWGRFGQLFLQDGVWNGERLLPEGWVAYSTTPTPQASQGRYGSQWWLNHGTPGRPEDRAFPLLPADAYWADGYDGQMVMVVPSRDAVVVRLGLTKDESAYPAEEILAGVLAALDAKTLLNSSLEDDEAAAPQGQR